MPRCPECKKWFFLVKFTPLNDGTGRKVCERCFEIYRIMKSKLKPPPTPPL